MFDLSKIKPKSSFKYWFARQHITDLFDIFVCETDDAGETKYTRIGRCGTLLKNKYCITPDKNFKDYESINFDAIKSDFNDFFNRPEYIIGIPVPKEILETTGINAATYEKLIAGCMLLHENDEEKALNNAKVYLDWLKETDFFVAPWSTRFHDAEPEGLLKHTLRVVNHAIALMHLKKFSGVVLHEAILAALVHDLSKIGIYKSYLKNVKDDETGLWSKVPAYQYKTSDWPLTHGVTSMYLAGKFFKLSLEQNLAIRYHMGAFHMSQNDLSELSEANTRFPMVHLLQWSDSFSITIYGEEV